MSHALQRLPPPSRRGPDGEGGWVGSAGFEAVGRRRSVGEGEGPRTGQNRRKTKRRRQPTFPRARSKEVSREFGIVIVPACLPVAAIKSWHHYLTGFPSSSSPEICLRIASIFRWANEEQQMSAASLAPSNDFPLDRLSLSRSLSVDRGAV